MKSGKMARVIRIAKTNNPVMFNPPNIGDTVRVIVKPYHLQIYATGVVRRVLTKKKMHARGFKVMLESGTVGRMVSA